MHLKRFGKKKKKKLPPYLLYFFAIIPKGFTCGFLPNGNIQDILTK